MKKILYTILLTILICSCQLNKYDKKPTGNPVYLPSEELNVPQTDENYESSLTTPIIRENIIFEKTAQDGITNIAIFLPLSGNGSNIGQSMKRAIQLGFSKADKSKISYEFFDTESSIEGTNKAYLQASKYKIDVILGPLYSQNVKALSRQTSTPIISFTTDDNSISRGVYSLGVTPKEEIRNLKKHIKDDKRLVVLLPNSSMGRMYNNELSNYKIKSEKISFYTPSDLYTVQQQIRKLTNFDNRKKELSQIKKSIENNSSLSPSQKKQELKKYENRDTISGVDFDSILVIGDTEDVKGIISYLRYFEVDPKKVDYLGTSIMSNDKVLTDPNFTNVAFISPLLKDKKSFITMYEKTFNQAPHSLAITGYDGAKLIQELSKNGYFDKEGLISENGFKGLNGLFKISPNGISEYEMDLYQITGRGTYKKVIK